MPPWTILDVERDANVSDVKERFRALSRTLHPDKMRDPEDRKVSEAVFPLIQSAYAGLKDSKEAEHFRQNAEADEFLFSRSRHVEELTPEADKVRAKGGTETLWLQCDSTTLSY